MSPIVHSHGWITKQEKPAMLLLRPVLLYYITPSPVVDHVYMGQYLHVLDSISQSSTLPRARSVVMKARKVRERWWKGGSDRSESHASWRWLRKRRGAIGVVNLCKCNLEQNREDSLGRKNTGYIHVRGVQSRDSHCNWFISVYLNGCSSKTIDASSCSNVRSWVFNHPTTFVNLSRGSAYGQWEILTQDSNSLMIDPG